jgi:hypothetical protein
MYINKTRRERETVKEEGNEKEEKPAKAERGSGVRLRMPAKVGHQAMITESGRRTKVSAKVARCRQGKSVHSDAPPVGG